jgi:hypothetical protein
MIDTQTKPAQAKTGAEKPRGCGQHHHAHECDCGCKPECSCKIECFERPNYFCGHLLTDADLKLDQKYVIEKHKLYNRSLHGHGVVCGLRLTCDPECRDAILVGDGYAIDQCGDDLIVCEPRRVLIEDCDPPKEDEDCEKPSRKPDCEERKCYYIAICYDEDESDYTTPFKANCGSGPAPCEPTRVHETVKFKVLHELPGHESALDRLEDRIMRCYAILNEGEFSDELKGYTSKYVEGTQHKYPCETFNRLKVFFKRWLRKHPDPVNCCLWEEVECLECPPNADGAAASNAYEKLLRLVHVYIDDCVRNELTFCCPEADCDSCIVLGTVEVVDGKICRICTCHREYVWSFATLQDVLAYELLVNLDCTYQPTLSQEGIRGGDQEKGRNETGHHQCCPEREIVLDWFLRLFHTDRRSAEYTATASITSARSAMLQLSRGFGHTQPAVMSARTIQNKPLQVAQALMSRFQIGLEDAAVETKLDAITGFLPGFLQRSGDKIFASTENNLVKAAVPQLHAPLPAEADLARQIQELKKEIETLRNEKADKPPSGEAGPRKKTPSPK